MGNIPAVATGQKATADQYNALQAGLNPLVENDYTSWKLITNVATPAVSNYVIPGTTIIDEAGGFIYFFDYNNGFLWVMDIQGTNITRPTTEYVNIGATSWIGYSSNARPYSMNMKYLVAYHGNTITASDVKVYIITGGKIVQTIVVGSYFSIPNSYSGISLGAVISQTGRYLVVFGPAAANDTQMQVLVYEGQP